MDYYKYFIKYISFPLISRYDGKPELNKRYKILLKSQYNSTDEIREYQLAALKNILIHAFENTIYYNLLFKKVGFDPYKIQDLKAVNVIPCLNKKIIRENFDHLLANNYKNNEIHYAETGGTSGVKMKFARDNACLSLKEAALCRFENWAGWDIGDRLGIVWTAQQDYVGHWTLRSRIKNFLYFRQIVFPAAIIEQESIKRYLGLLKKHTPTIIRSFSSPMFETAKYALDHNIQIEGIKGIITTGEPLYEHQRNIIEKAFNTKTYNSYRCREVGPIAQECEHSSREGMHVNADGVYVEVIPQQYEDRGTGVGNVVVTDLWNYGMPMIRYEMGDLTSFSDKPCVCGRGLPLIGEILGRVVDNLYTPDKKVISGGSIVLYLVDEAPGNIGQIQVIQEAYDHLVIKITKDPPPSAALQQYHRSVVERLFGGKMRVSHEEVDSIPREKSGKYRFTICNIK